MVLGIDAAWTAEQPSGVALVEVGGGRYRCIAVAPSYATFMALASDEPVPWGQRRFPGQAIDVKQVLEAACKIAQASVELVAVDMPMANVPISSRRSADDEISRAFGTRGCSTHTPSGTRPGDLGARLSAGFVSAGYPLATDATPVGTTPSLIEVYPHPAVLTLLRRDYRVPYKVAKAKRYFPRESPAQRTANLITEFRAIYDALGGVFGSLTIPPPPSASEVATAQHLKPYEDALDALVCAWVGGLYVEGAALPYGDETCAIWCPVEAGRLPEAATAAAV